MSLTFISGMMGNICMFVVVSKFYDHLNTITVLIIRVKKGIFFSYFSMNKYLGKMVLIRDHNMFYGEIWKIITVTPHKKDLTILQCAKKVMVG